MTPMIAESLAEVMNAPLATTILLLVAGAIAGFAGGLFGIGGGIFMVPVLVFFFDAAGVSPFIQIRLAIGTSLAVIIVTSLRSLQAHWKTGLVDGELLRRFAPWVAIGAFAAGYVASMLPTRALMIIFAVGAFIVGISKFRAGREKPTSSMGSDSASSSPSVWFFRLPGFFTGLFSSLLGIGGGAAGVVLLSGLGRSIHQAVATAAGFGVCVSIPGALAMMRAGWGHPALPEGALGFVFIPAFFTLAIATLITAPLGARAAHRMDGRHLSVAFGLYVLVMACWMFWKAVNLS